MNRVNIIDCGVKHKASDVEEVDFVDDLNWGEGSIVVDGSTESCGTESMHGANGIDDSDDKDRNVCVSSIDDENGVIACIIKSGTRLCL